MAANPISEDQQPTISLPVVSITDVDQKRTRRGRRKPCEHCRRRQRRMLVTAITTISLAGGAAAAGLLLPSSSSTQLADVTINRPITTSPSQTIPTVQKDDKEPRHIIIIPITTSPAIANTPTQTYTPTPTPTPTTTVTASPASATATPTTTVTASSTSTTATSASSTVAASSSSIGLEVLNEAETRQGDPYVYAAAGPYSFDCSGLVYWAALQVGITNMPRDTYSMLGQGVASGLLVQTTNPQLGDLAFFGSGHVEFYIKPGETFGAQQPGTSVGYHSYGYGYAPTEFFQIV